MVKLYLEENSKGLREDEDGKYLNINVWSLVKAYIISGLIVGSAVLLLSFILGFASVFI